MPINYTISIDDRAVLIVVRQYDSAGGEVSIANINVPESDAELQRAVDRSAIELLRTIKKAIDENWAVDFNEISANIDAVLKTAEGR